MNELKQNEKVIANIVLGGDLSRLNAEEKVMYYKGYCERLGLDPFTKPFDILRLNGREILYCTRSGAQQLNKLHEVSHKIVARETIQDAGVYYVIAQASLPNGRCTESIGAVNISGYKGDQLANALMKAETKAKRRSTLDLLGLGVIDETELETVPNTEKIIMPVIEDKQPVIETDKPKRGRKKTNEPEIEPSIFERNYENADDIEQALGLAATIDELKRLYFSNQLMIESNKELKNKFSNTKNEISNGK